MTPEKILKEVSIISFMVPLFFISEQLIAQLNAGFTSDTTSVCSGSSVTFTDSSTGVLPATVYSWNFGTGAQPASASGAGPHKVVYTGAGNATVSLTVTNDTVTSTVTKPGYINIVDCVQPDLTLTLIANPNIMPGISDFNVIVQVSELNGRNTSASITVNFPSDSRWVLPDGFNKNLKTVGSTTVDNSIWNYSADAVNHVFFTSATILAGKSVSFGFKVRFDPGNTSGVYSMTARVAAGSGGETLTSNNTDSEVLDFFDQ